MLTVENFERHFNGYMVGLIRHLVKSEQAKNAVLDVMSEVMRVSKDDALRFYKKYKESLDV